MGFTLLTQISSTLNQKPVSSIQYLFFLKEPFLENYEDDHTGSDG